MRKFKNLTRATAVLVWTAEIAGAGIVYDNGGPVGVTGNGFSIILKTAVIRKAELFVGCHRGSFL